MSPRDVFILMVAVALLMAISRGRGRWFAARPKRERRETLEEQIESDFPPIHRDEARMLVESILPHARPDDREMVWRRVLDAARCDIVRLRKVAPKAGASLEKVYRLLGGRDDDLTPG